MKEFLQNSDLEIPDFLINLINLKAKVTGRVIGTLDQFEGVFTFIFSSGCIFSFFAPSNCCQPTQLTLTVKPPGLRRFAQQLDRQLRSLGFTAAAGWLA